MNKDQSMHRLLRRTADAREEARQPEGCLDAETLAAWSDGSLTPAERASAEAHAADCDRCLALVAAMAKTTPPPSTVRKSSWLSVRWLVPLTTAAVAITAWVLIHEPRVSPVPPPNESALDAVRPAESDVQRERDANARATATAPQQQVAPPVASNAREQARLRRSDQAASKESAATADKVARNEQPAARIAEGRAASPPPPAAAAAPQATPLSRSEAKDERLQSKTAAFRQLSPVITSTDPNIRWRIAGQSVERSTDAGRTWKTQPTGTAVELLGGSSPAPNVCWIVGRSGLVLLSADGETWRRLAPPDATVDLVGVTARDAVAATVTAADGRRFSTADAGRTWTLQEIPVTPF